MHNDKIHETKLVGLDAVKKAVVDIGRRVVQRRLLAMDGGARMEVNPNPSESEVMHHRVGGNSKCQI